MEHLRFTFSSRELKELGVSAVGIAFVFAFYYSGGIPEIWVFIMALVGVSTGFIAHELAHKFTAQRFGCWAEYRMWEMGLLIALFLVVAFRLLFIAPGAVYIVPGFRGITRQEDGIISASGAVANLAVGCVFLLVGFGFGASINAWLALFNMLPVPPLDGSKVIRWNPGAWAGIAGGALLLLLLA